MKWKKTIFFSLIIGGLGFFILFSFSRYYLFPLFEKRIERVGYAGVYYADSIPNNVLNDISFGLTKIDKAGKTFPGVAHKWEIKDDGKKYIFYLKKNLKFHNGKKLTAKNLPLSFKDVKKKVINDYVIEYSLKDKYSPFLTSVSKPLLIDNFQGLGKYKVTKIEINGGFVKSIQITNIDDDTYRRVIYFYPTQLALKTAFMLGEVSIIHDVNDLQIENTSFSNWKNINIKKTVSYKDLVTLFYNNNDKYLSNKKIRQALQYSLPKNFSQGERAYSPISPMSIYFSKPPNYGVNDKEIAKNLLPEKPEFNYEIEISTSEEFIKIAELVSRSWNEIGIRTKIKKVSEIPKNFQVLLYSFKIPMDPDQYTIWHSDQINNIMKYKNLRIDKLLEDGRSITDIEKRTSIYSDFQKYLTDDAPASFLYFPNTYSLSRK